MIGIDADPDRLEHRLRGSAPQPRVVDETGEARSAGRLGPVTDGAIVAEERAPRLAHVLHQILVSLDGGKALLFDTIRPPRPVERRLLQACLDVLAHIGTEEAFRIGLAQRPGWHQHPVDEREQRRPDQEIPRRLRYGRIQLDDTVPLMAGRHVAGMGIAFLHAHGPFSSSMMLLAARSNRFPLPGQNV